MSEGLGRRAELVAARLATMGADRDRRLAELALADREVRLCRRAGRPCWEERARRQRAWDRCHGHGDFDRGPR